MDLRLPRNRGFWASRETRHKAEILHSFQIESRELAHRRKCAASAVSKDAKSAGRNPLKKRDRTVGDSRVSNHLFWYSLLRIPTRALLRTSRHLLGCRNSRSTLAQATIREPQFYLRPFRVQDAEVHGIPHSTTPSNDVITKGAFFLGPKAKNGGAGLLV